MHEEHSCTCNQLSPVEIEKCNSAKRAPVVKFHGGGYHWAESCASQAFQGSWRGITEGSSELRWISNLKHNTFYLLPHSGKQELAHGPNSKADFSSLALPTGSEGRKQRCFTLIAWCLLLFSFSLYLALSLQKRKIHSALNNKINPSEITIRHWTAW